MKIKSYNPANNELLGEINQTDVNEIKIIVSKSKKAFESWGFLTITERISYIKKLYEAFKSKKNEFAKLITNEMGMPISESLFGIDSGLEHIEWYINNVEKILGNKTTYEDDKEIDKIIFEPKGVTPKFDRKIMEIHICNPVISRITYVYFSSESCCEKLIFFS